MQGKDELLLLHLAQWLTDEALDKREEVWDVLSWPRYHPQNIPRQRNGCDCGVFAVMFADYLGLGRPMHWGQGVSGAWCTGCVGYVIRTVVVRLRNCFALSDSGQSATTL